MDIFNGVEALPGASVRLAVGWCSGFVAGSQLNSTLMPLHNVGWKRREASA